MELAVCEFVSSCNSYDGSVFFSQFVQFYTHSSTAVAKQTTREEELDGRLALLFCTTLLPRHHYCLRFAAQRFFSLSSTLGTFLDLC